MVKSGVEFSAGTVDRPTRQLVLWIALIAMVATGAITGCSSSPSQRAVQTPASPVLTWRLTDIPTAGTYQDEYHSVSCPTVAFCLASGFSIDMQSGPVTPVHHENLARYDGQHWTLMSQGPDIDTVACGSSTFCLGVFPKWWRFDGQSWAAIPDPPVDTQRVGILHPSCVGNAGCWIASGGDNAVPTAAFYNGRSWVAQPLPLPSGDRRGLQYLDVSCPATNACMAVGGRQIATATSFTAATTTPIQIAEGFAAIWSGHGWKLTGSPPDGSLTSVSCPTLSSCTAVGVAADTTGITGSVVDHYDGHSWTAIYRSRDAFDSISCPTATFCVAVGTSGHGVGPVAVTYDGAITPQTLPTTPTEPGKPAIQTFGLRAVSCPTTAMCVAGGSRFPDAVPYLITTAGS